MVLRRELNCGFSKGVELAAELSRDKYREEKLIAKPESSDPGQLLYFIS